jgi:hypothetical protein
MKLMSRITQERQMEWIGSPQPISPTALNGTSQIALSMMRVACSHEKRLFWLQRESLKLTRKNDSIRPFEAGAEVELEHLARRADAGIFVLDSHSKKRPHNLILGRCDAQSMEVLIKHGGCMSGDIDLSEATVPTLSLGNSLGC